MLGVTEHSTATYVTSMYMVVVALLAVVAYVLSHIYNTPLSNELSQEKGCIS